MNKSIAVNSSKLNWIIAFLIGFLSANNIIYVFRVRNTTIKAITVVALLGLINVIISRGGKIKSPSNMIPSSLRYCFICILVSFVPVLFFNHDIIYQWMVGIVAMMLMASVVALVLLLYEDYKDAIYRGILVGFVVNAVLILWGLYNHSKGVAFTLADYFPYELIAPVYIRGSYRGSGLFREAGHLMRYATVFGIPLIYYYMLDRRKRIISLISIVIILAYTRSSTVVALGVEVILLILIHSGKDAKSFWRAVAIIIGIIIASIVVVPIRNFITSEIFSGFVDFTTYREQTTRLTGMRSALRVAEQYPVIGSGWNTLSMLFQKNGYNIFISNKYGGGEFVSAAFSEGLTLLAEIGIFSFFYYWFVLKSAVALIRFKDNLSVAMGVSLIGYFILFFITDFSFNLNGCVAVLIGLTAGRLTEKKRESAQG